MTDKVQKIREEVERLMYGFNLEADVASCEDVETEKLANIKYQLCKKILDYIDEVQKEPVSVSKELEEEIQKTIHNHFFDLDGIAIAGTSVYATVDDMVYIAKHFANWQKEQMMAKAIDVEVKIDAGGYPYIPQIELWDYDKDEPLAEEGNKVKVIVIKED